MTRSVRMLWIRMVVVVASLVSFLSRVFFYVFCSITLGGFGADRFYLGQWREGLGKLFSFGGLGIWTLIDVLLIGVGYVGPADGSLYIWSRSLGIWLGGWALFHLPPLHSQTEDLRCHVLSTFVWPSSLCNTSPSHLLSWEVFSLSHQWCLFPHNHHINPSH